MMVVMSVHQLSPMQGPVFFFKFLKSKSDFRHGEKTNCHDLMMIGEFKSVCRFKIYLETRVSEKIISLETDLRSLITLATIVFSMLKITTGLKIFVSNHRHIGAERWADFSL